MTFFFLLLSTLSCAATARIVRDAWAGLQPAAALQVPLRRRSLLRGLDIPRRARPRMPAIVESKTLTRRSRELALKAAGALERVNKSALVVGAGPAGLLSATMLAQLGWTNVTVVDEREAPPRPDDPLWCAGERSYQIGLNGRGQKSLRDFRVMGAIDDFAARVNGRLAFKDGEPLEERFKPGEKSYVTRVLQRDRLQACLLDELQRSHPEVKIVFGMTCDSLNLDGERPSVGCCRSSPQLEEGEEAQDVECELDAVFSEFDLVIGADGVRSVVRDSIEAVADSRTRTVRFPDNNERRYKIIPLHPSAVPGTAADLNWGARGNKFGLGWNALPTMEGEMINVLLFKPDSPIFERIESLATGQEAKAFFQEVLPELVPYMRDDDLETFVKRPISRLPSFLMVQGDIHYSMARGGVVLLGDAIKTVKPYFGQGANSALEDVSVLRDCLDVHEDLPAAVACFSAARAEEARALVRTSRSFDGKGPLGTFRFIVPLLLDVFLNRVFPQVFTPPILRGLQDEKNSFTGLRKRKRLERLIVAAAVFGTVLRPRGALAVMLATYTGSALAGRRGALWRVPFSGERVGRE